MHSKIVSIYYYVACGSSIRIWGLGTREQVSRDSHFMHTKIQEIVANTRNTPKLKRKLHLLGGENIKV